MKHLKISLKLLVLLMVIGFMVAGCQKEDDHHTEHITGKNTGDVNARLINLDELKQVQTLKPHLDAIERTFDIHKAKTDAQSKIDATDGSFTILTDEILQVTTDYSEAYTFRIETPTVAEATFENFIIKRKDNQSDFHYYIYSYKTVTLSDNTDFTFVISLQEVDKDLVNIDMAPYTGDSKMAMVNNCLYELDGEGKPIGEPVWCFGSGSGGSMGFGGLGPINNGDSYQGSWVYYPDGNGTCTRIKQEFVVTNYETYVDDYGELSGYWQTVVEEGVACPNGMGDENGNNPGNGDIDDDPHWDGTNPIETGSSSTGNGNSNSTPIGALPSINYAELAELCLGFAGTNTNCIPFGNKKALGMYIEDNGCNTFAQEVGETMCENPNLSFEEAMDIYVWEDLVLFDDISDPEITNIVDYLECFNLTAGAELTIYVDQPKANSADPYRITWNPLDPVDVGHTFIVIKQGGITRNLGYYPGGSIEPSNGINSANSIIRNNSNHDYDVSIKKSISATQLSNIYNIIVNSNATYDLNTYNCTDFGIEIGNAGGMNLPDTSGSWPYGGNGSNPGNLGQDIRNMSLPSGTTRQTSSGSSVSNSGGC